MRNDRDDADAEIDLRAVASSLWAGRWWIVACMLVCTAALTAVAFLTTPVYRAATVVVAAGPERSGMGALSSALGQLGGLASLAGIDMNPGASQAEESLAVLRSREFTEGFIRDHKLMPELFPKRWDANARRWKGPKEDWPTLAQGFKYFDQKVRKVTQDRKTQLITVSIEWRDRVKAAEWANALVARLNAEMRARAIAKTNASVGFLERELAATSEIDTRQAINRLMEAQINQRMLANVTEEYALRVVDKALPADPKDPVKPKKLVLMGLGPILGMLLGAVGVLIAGAWVGARKA